MSNSESWKKLQCRDCENLNGLEFSTGDGDEPQSVILCGSCSGHWKNYVIQRGYDIDFDEYFGPIHCQSCENSDLENLRSPKNFRGKASKVSCLDCMEDNDN